MKFIYWKISSLDQFDLLESSEYEERFRRTNYFPVRAKYYLLKNVFSIILSDETYWQLSFKNWKLILLDQTWKTYLRHQQVRRMKDCRWQVWLQQFYLQYYCLAIHSHWIDSWNLSTAVHDDISKGLNDLQVVRVIICTEQTVDKTGVKSDLTR